ncbi:MAG TPA: DUF2804 domain-containing protein [Candidatus Fimenecus excrementigallinarum]|uniref:DUF2804 domain-containing protein n=1 Tax=Candidatus Fimenecus excrementigallinarum TaxID=2840816 RepID=A0A9D1IEE7_9FIRM|nr:DUF2804 domain-containing protein [Candidatus Fimenecus excrementigallinarum]
MQHEITKRTPLLDENGNLSEPGYCVHNLYDYDRRAVRANPLRIKEWDFYQISDKRYTIQMTIASISYGGMAGVTLFDRQTGERHECTALSLLTFDKYHLPSNTEVPHKIVVERPHFHMSFDVTERHRILKLRGRNRKGGDFKVDVVYDVMPGLQSLVMAVPFRQKGHFYLNQKINCMPAHVQVRLGKRVITFDPETSFGLLDWGRGVWPFAQSWYWGNGSSYLPDGRIFGFEIGWGFGSMDAASENTLFLDGVAHKIDQVYLQKDPKDYMRPWVFSSNDGRFEMTMTPEFDNYTNLRFFGVGNRCHQVFGKWNGSVVLDDGTKLDIRDMTAFCEFSDNHW